MTVINKGLEIHIYPNEDIIQLIHQYIGNARFVWNNVLERYQELYEKCKESEENVNPSLSFFNTILNDLKEENSFLKEGESTSQQQVLRDLVQAFNKFFNEGTGFPKRKTKKHSKKTFRVQNNNNSIRTEENKIRIPKLGFIKFKTSKEYKKTLKNCKINNATIKYKNGEYYAIVNVEVEHKPLKCCDNDSGIDLGMKTLAIMDDGTKIANLNLTHEEKQIRKYQKQLARQKYRSNNYYKTLKKLYKWTNKLNNKKKDYLHKISLNIVKNNQNICMETLNIKGMLQNQKLSHKLHVISLSKFVEMIKYKCHWNNRNFIQVDMFFPSSKLCNECNEKYEELTLDMREWICPHCNTQHDRDINAAKNILKEGLRILTTQYATA